MTLIASPFPQITSPPQALAEVLVNEALAALPSTVYAYAYQTSSGLTFGYYGGRWGGFSIAAGTLALTGSTDNYVVVAKASGAISTSTSATNWNDGTNYARVFKITTLTATITSAEDHRSGPSGVHGGGAGGVGGGAASGLEYISSSTTTDSDPGTGVLRWNNATQASATILYIDNAEADGASIATLWAALAVGTLFKITKADDPDTWQIWKLNSAQTNGTGYYKFPVTLMAQEGSDIGTGVSILLDVDSSAVVTSFTGGTLTSALNEAPAVTIASASTVNIGAAAANTIEISGTTTITAFDTIAASALRWIYFQGALTLTHNGTSLILPTAANIVTVAGDRALMESLGSGNWRCVLYMRKSGAALVGTPASDGDYGDVVVSSSGTVWTLDSSVTPVGKHAVPIVAGAMRPSQTGGCAALALIATTANQPDISSLDFDASTEEYAQFLVPMPKSWNEGTITAQFVWSHAATATNFAVVWAIQAVATSDADAIAAAFGTAQTVTDTGGTTNTQYISAATSAMTVGGSPAAEDVVHFRVYRKSADGSDTLAIDARLHAVVLFLTTDAGNDA